MSHTRAFPSQALDPAEELSLSAARERGHFVLAWEVEGQVERIEVHGPAGVTQVTWFNPSEPDDKLLIRHRVLYPGLPARIQRGPSGGDGERWQLTSAFDPAGRLVGVNEEQMGEDGIIFYARWLNGQGELLEEARYTRDSAGELLRVEERGQAERDWAVVFDAEED